MLGSAPPGCAVTRRFDAESGEPRPQPHGERQSGHQVAAVAVRIALALIASIAPAASAVSETVPTSVLPWAQYHWQIMTIAIVLLLLQAVLIAGLLLER